MGTSMRMAGGSLADDEGSQESAALVEHRYSTSVLTDGRRSPWDLKLLGRTACRDDLYTFP